MLVATDFLASGNYFFLHFSETSASFFFLFFRLVETMFQEKW